MRPLRDLCFDAFEESKHPRDDDGKFSEAPKRDFEELIKKRDWSRVTKSSDMIENTPTGSVTLRRGPARVQLSFADLVERPDGTVSYYQASPGSVVLSGLVVDPQDRRKGHAKTAVTDVIGLAKEMGSKTIYLETTPMGKHKPKMKADALSAFYSKLGFKHVSPRVMKYDIDEGKLSEVAIPRPRSELITEYKELREAVREFPEYLTAARAKDYKEKAARLSGLRFDLHRPLTSGRVLPASETKSALDPEVAVAADADLHRNRDIYTAITSAVHGSDYGSFTAVDDIVAGKNSAISASDLYAAFEGSRSALREQFGDTVEVYRSEGKQIRKPTKNWATTREFAGQFGGDVTTKEVSVDDVLVVFVSARGKYHELIVREAKRANDSFLRLVSGDDADFESKHPREADGEFAEIAGGNAKVLDVGGDDWNKKTAYRLEREYVKAKANLQAHVDDAIEKGMTIWSKRRNEWNDLSEKDRDRAEEKWKEETYREYYDNEVHVWMTSGEGADEAKRILVDRFNDGLKSDWAIEALKSWLEVNEYAGLSVNKILDHTTLSWDHNGLSVKVGLDELTELQLSEIHEALEEAIGDEAPDVDVEPLDLSESVLESLDHDWGELDEGEKYQFAVNALNLQDDDAESSTKVELPEKFDPFGESAETSRSASANYRKTQTLARYLSIARARELIEHRTGVEASENDVSNFDELLWDDWKKSSSSGGGVLLQLAMAEELGGRLRLGEVLRSNAYKDADRWARNLGGYEGVKAYVRAKWETTQFLLDKADAQTVEVYRALKTFDFPESKATKEVEVKNIKETPNKHYASWQHLPDLQVQRNGAASTTISPRVANDWDGDRIVLRAKVPRTAVLSVPCYGINVHEEKEVVVGGLAWHGWDVWAGRAPPFDAVPMRIKNAEPERKVA